MFEILINPINIPQFKKVRIILDVGITISIKIRKPTINYVLFGFILKLRESLLERFEILGDENHVKKDGLNQYNF